MAHVVRKATPLHPHIGVLEPLRAWPDQPLFEALHIVDSVEWPMYAADPWQIDACKLERCSLSGYDLQRLKLWDSVLVRTDMSGACIFEAGVLRTELLGCRLSGVQFGEGTLKDVQFQQCKLDLASFRACRLERVVFTHCVLNEADFAGAQLHDVTFIDCELTQTIFDKVQCRGVDLTGSDISDIRGVMSLKGVRIRREQMIQLAPLLCGEVGLLVTDE